MFSRPDKNIHNKNTENIHPIDEAFEKVRQWMTLEEIESYGAEEYRFSILLSMILHRNKEIRKLIEAYRVNAAPEWQEKLSRLDESVQVYHFFYQSALDQFNDDYRKCVKVLNEKIDEWKNK